MKYEKFFITSSLEFILPKCKNYFIVVVVGATGTIGIFDPKYHKMNIKSKFCIGFITNSINFMPVRPYITFSFKYWIMQKLYKGLLSLMPQSYFRKIMHFIVVSRSFLLLVF